MTSRYAYRSQPTLQRTPDALPRWVRLTAVWSVVAIGLLIASRALTVATMEDVGPPPPVIAAALPPAVDAPPEAAPVAVAAASLPPAAAPAPPATEAVPRVAERQTRPVPSATPTRKLAVVTPAPGRAAAAPRTRSDYRKALDIYAAQERSAGFRWARQNRVTVRDYCRATARQRTPAFMQGCMAYLETGAG